MSLKSNKQKSQDVPYDYFSLMHYGSDYFVKAPTTKNMLSKYPALVKEKNKRYDINRRKSLSRLDILQIQRFYECKELKKPDIVAFKPSREKRKVKMLRKLLLKDKLKDEMDESLIEKYAQRSIRT